MTKKKTARRKKAPAPPAKKTKPGLTPLNIILAVAFIVLAPAVFYGLIRLAISRVPAPVLETNPPPVNNDLLLDEYRLALTTYLSELKPLFRDQEFKGKASTDRLIGEYVKTAREILEVDIIFYRHDDQLPEAVASRLSHGLPLDDESIYGDRNAITLDRALGYYRSVCREKIKFEALFLAGRLSGPELKKLAALKVAADEIDKALQGKDEVKLKEVAARLRPVE